MEDFESSPHTQQHQGEHTEQSHVLNEQSLLEEAGNLSPAKEKPHELFTEGPDDYLVQQQHHSPKNNLDLLDFGDQFGAQQQQHEDLLLEHESHSPVKEPEEHKPEHRNDFDFDKELPSIPSDSQINEDLQMNFSNSHFQAEEHQPFDDSPTEELMKQHEGFHPHEEFLKQEEVSQPFEEEDEQLIQEPVLQASMQKVEESQSSPWKSEESQSSHEKAEESKSSHEIEEQIPGPVPVKHEEVPLSPSFGQHRPAPPIPVEEPEPKTTSPKVEQPVVPPKTSTTSPPSKDRPAEQVTSTEGSGKTRSVRSTKTADTTSGRVFLGRFLSC